MINKKRGNSLIDNKLGQYIRKMRLLKGLRQVELASVIGVTFQQLQKYETGINKLHMGRLLHICNALNMDLSYFFIGFKEFLEQEQHGSVLSDYYSSDAITFAHSETENPKEIIRLIEAYQSIKSARIKKQLNRLIKELSQVHGTNNN